MIEDAHHVIGDGVCTFWFVRCNSVDSNTRTLRTDFLVRRWDMTDVRLHPQTAKNKATGVAEAIPVYGSWEDWRMGVGIGSLWHCCVAGHPKGRARQCERRRVRWLQ